jgi:murein DD-endopeptidase MepM/ murein hydrolase activator NlpD
MIRNMPAIPALSVPKRAAMPRKRPLALMALLLITGCGNGLDWDMRGGNGFNTRDAALSVTEPPPVGDANGLITYSGYQAVQARGGESVADIAGRFGLNADELARFNALRPDDRLRTGEVLVLPTMVANTPAMGGAGGGVDVTTLASTALDRVSTSTLAPAPLTAAPLAPAPLAAPQSAEPARHKVQRGETAFGIARTYGVSSKALAEWNGLGPDLGVREGQFLIIPVAGAPAPVRTAATAPGAGSQTPVPPSAAQPLPDEDTVPAAQTQAAAAQPVADLSSNISAGSSATFAMPVSGKIIRGYAKGKNDGIDIAAAAGTPVKAAGAGTVAAITKDTSGTPIVVIRHAGGLLTVYAGVEGLKVAKGDTVARGQTIAAVRAADPSFLHFEVRKGVESMDPMNYLQ